MSKSTFALSRVPLCALVLGILPGALWAQQPVPSINSIAPASTAPLAAGSTSSVIISITGENFGTNPRVVFDGTYLNPPAMTSPNPAYVQAVVPASLLATPHLAQVYVANLANLAATQKGGSAKNLVAVTPVIGASNILYFPVSNQLSNLALNAGTAFGPAVPVSIVSGDVNGDGFTDVVVGASDGTIQVFLGDGKGGFAPPAVVGATVKPTVVVANSITPVALALGDFNNDGKLDLVRADAVLSSTAGPSSSVTILLGDGQGNFAASTTATSSDTALPAGVTGLLVGDFNGDGALDVGVTISGAAPTGGFYSLQGDGNGGLVVDSTGAVVFSIGTAGAQSSAVASGDFNKDGVTDVLVADSGDNNVRFLQGTITGTQATFALPTTGGVFPASAPPTSIVVGDFNKDGFDDFATVNNDGSLSVYLGDGTGNFSQPPQPVALTAKAKAKAKAKANAVKANAGTATQVVIVTGDFDADGNLDLATFDGANIQIYLGNGGGLFSLTSTTPSAGSPILALGDVNSDGQLDLFAGSPSPNGVTPFTNAGTPAGTATLSVPTSLAFGSVNIGVATPKSLVVTNTGTVPVNFSAASITGTNAADFVITTNGCNTALASGASCNILVTFTPTVPSAETAMLQLTDDAGAQSVMLTGTGVAVPTATISPASLSFGNVNVNASSTLQLTVTNSGSGSLTVSQASINVSSFVLGTNGCTTALTSGQSCTISVVFAPTSVGAVSGMLVITDNSSTGTSQTVPLSGTGVGTPVASVSPASLAFGNQAVGSTSAPQVITLKNTGTAPLTIASITGSGAPFATTTTCGASLAVGASCTVNVTFAPTATGSAAGTVTFTDNASPATQTVTLSGAGASATGPKAVVAPTSLTFGNQNVGSTSNSHSVTLTNSGTSALSISSVKVTAPFAIVGNSCGATLPVNRTCTVLVAFRPTAQGPATGTLTFTDNSVLGTTQVVALSGAGVAPTAAVSPTSLTFAAQSVGTTSAAQVVTLSNTGTGALDINSISASGDFQISARTCGNTLAAGASCTVSVVFHPNASGTRTGSLTFRDDSSTGATQTVTLTGTGVLRRLAANPGLLAFQARTGQKSSAQTVTVSNTGTATVTFSGFTLTGAGAAKFTISANTCGATLAAGANCKVSLVFSSTTRGNFNGQLNVTSDAPAVAVGLFGTAI